MHLRHVLTPPLLAALLCAAGANTGRAAEANKAEKPAEKNALDPKVLDNQIYGTLRNVINQGADIYNSGDYLGCYRLYEGALTAFRPVLAHRPNLQKAIDDALIQARTSARGEDKAFILRAVIDQIRKETNPSRTTTVTPVAKTLWDRLGGEKGVSKVVHDFVAAAGSDPKVDFTRGGKYKLNGPDLEKKLVEMISSVSGGPLKYSGRNMKEVHKGMGITNEEFDVSAGHLAAALKKNGVKEEDARSVMDVVNGTRKDIVEGKNPIPPKPTTLLEKLNGEAGLAKVVDDFVAAAEKDPKVNLTQGGKVKIDAVYKGNWAARIAAAAGGPGALVAKPLVAADADFDAVLKHLGDALKKHGLSEADAKTIVTAVGAKRADLVEQKAPEPPKPTTLWDKLGGEKVISKVVDDFFASAAKDPKVNLDRNGTLKREGDALAEAKKKLVQWISSQTGGPLKYTGKDMKAAHKGLGITDEEFEATGKHLADALKKNNVKEEDAKALLDIFIKFKGDVVEPKKPEPMPPSAKLWDRLGGAEGVGKIVDEFVNTSLADPKLHLYGDAKPTKDQVSKLKASMTEVLSKASAGPTKATDKELMEVFKGLKTTDAEFADLTDHLKKTLKKQMVKDEDIKTVVDKFGALHKDASKPNP